MGRSKKIKPINISFRKMEIAERHEKLKDQPVMENMLNFLKAHPDIEKAWIENIRKRIRESKKGNK